MNERIMTHWLTDWLNECMNEWKNDLKNKLIKEIMYEWMDKWIIINFSVVSSVSHVTTVIFFGWLYRLD